MSKTKVLFVIDMQNDRYPKQEFEEIDYEKN